MASTSTDGTSFSYSKYYLELKGDEKKRYDEKLKLINCDKDPYCQVESPETFSGVSIQWYEWPNLMYADIYNYLILTPSLYTHDQLKSYRSLEAYNQFVNRWVSDIVVTVNTANKAKVYVFTALVKHSQSLSLPSLKPWVAIDQSGIVVCAHCTCMAGYGEACSHVASVLFTVEANTQMKQQFPCTSLPCSWLPSSFRSVPFSEISNIDFTTPHHKRMHCHNDFTSTGGDGESVQKKKKLIIPKATDNDLSIFYNTLSKTKGKPVLLSLISKYNDSYVPETEAGILPKPLTSLHDPEAMKMSYPDLLNRCESIYQSVSFTFNQAVLVEERTRIQAKCRSWFELRAGRITASKFREAVHTSYLQPSISLIKSICYPEQREFTSTACQYGCKHEDTARQAYLEKLKIKHENFLVIQCGLILDPEFPFMGATPDGLVNCKCCSSGVLEIKCPFSCKHKGFKTVASENPSFFLVDDNGSLKLKEDHKYYYQIQLQMKLCRVHYCDFVAWRENDEIFYQRIYLDSDFIDNAIESVIPFIKFAVLPELVGMWFSKESVMPDMQSSGGSNDDTGITNSSSNVPGYCYCGSGEEYDSMIGCDSKDCPIEWFHYSCLKITAKDVPKGKYFCPDCHAQKSKKTRAKKR